MAEHVALFRGGPLDGELHAFPSDPGNVVAFPVLVEVGTVELHRYRLLGSVGGQSVYRYTGVNHG